MKAYEDGLGELKRYEVHPGLRRDGKNNLMDFYYDEAQMNKWRDSCLRSQENLRSKVEKFDREVTSAKQKYGTMSPTSSFQMDEPACKELFRRLESAVSEKEPLIISIISTVYEDLKEIHKQLGVFCAIDPKSDEVRQAQQYFMNLDILKGKTKAHQDLANCMEEHCKELEKILDQIKDIQLRQAQMI